MWEETRKGEEGDIIFFSSEHEKATRVPTTERFVAKVDSFLLQTNIYIYAQTKATPERKKRKSEIT